MCYETLKMLQMYYGLNNIVGSDVARNRNFRFPFAFSNEYICRKWQQYCKPICKENEYKELN